MKKSTSPTFLLELPLQVKNHQAKHLHGHFEAARNLYNALLGEAMNRLNKMRRDSRYGVARTLAKGPERNALFTLLRKEYGFSEYALHQSSRGGKPLVSNNGEERGEERHAPFLCCYIDIYKT